MSDTSLYILGHFVLVLKLVSIILTGVLTLIQLFPHSHDADQKVVEKSRRRLLAFVLAAVVVALFCQGAEYGVNAEEQGRTEAKHEKENQALLREFARTQLPLNKLGMELTLFVPVDNVENAIKQVRQTEAMKTNLWVPMPGTGKGKKLSLAGSNTPLYIGTQDTLKSLLSDPLHSTIPSTVRAPYDDCLLFSISEMFIYKPDKKQVGLDVRPDSNTWGQPSVNGGAPSSEKALSFTWSDVHTSLTKSQDFTSILDVPGSVVEIVGPEIENKSAELELTLISESQGAIYVELKHPSLPGGNKTIWRGEIPQSIKWGEDL